MIRTTMHQHLTTIAYHGRASPRKLPGKPSGGDHAIELARFIAIVNKLTGNRRISENAHESRRGRSENAETSKNYPSRVFAAVYSGVVGEDRARELGSVGKGYLLVWLRNPPNGLTLAGVTSGVGEALTTAFR